MTGVFSADSQPTAAAAAEREMMRERKRTDREGAASSHTN